MGKKRREDTNNPVPVSDTPKKARKGTTSSDPVSKKPKKTNNASVKVKSEPIEVKKEPVESVKSEQIYSDSSSSSGSESEKNFSKMDKKSMSDSNSDSDSDSSDSDSSPTSKDEREVEKPLASKSPEIVNQKNSVTNLIPVKSYTHPPKSSTSDSYHSDTEEEDKKRRKKQKKILQMQLNKKVKRSNFPRAAEIKQEIQSDEEGPDNIVSNNDELPDWPESDFAELIRRMEAQIPAKDNQKFDSRAAKLDWCKIAFGEYSPEDCMEAWLAISKRIRRFRTLAEILQDAREWVTKPWTNFYRGSKKNRHPDMPTRPLTTYMIYYLEKKDKVAKENPGMEMTQVSKIISEMYKTLSPTEREKYSEMAAKERRNFDVKLSTFYKEHPEIAQQQQQRKTQAREVTSKGPRKASNPFKLFFLDQLKMHGGDPTADKKVIEEEAKEKWRSLSDKKKLVWIDWALEDHKRYEDEIRAYRLEHPDYVPPNSSKSVLNKDERLIKERLAGKPIKPPNSAYSLFSRLMLQSDPDVKSIPPKQRMAEISRKWKEISDAQKEHYEEKVRAMQDAYKLEFASYLEGLSPEEREEELKKNQPKRKPSKAEEKAKKKALKNSALANKRNNKTKGDGALKLYKGEPKPPPVKVFDVFLQSFPHDRSRSESQREKEALKCWNILSDTKKEVYIQKHEELKQKYIEDFEVFLKSLSPDELKEFSVMKDLAKKSKVKEEREPVNGATGGDSNEETDDDEGSSSDSDSDGSDSGKSSKSSSSSGDSDS